MNKQTLFLLTFSIVLLGILGCAKIVAPTGGQKDTTPPKILGSQPEIGEKNYDSKELQIEFDEFVKIDNTGDILISPFTKEQPEYILKGKKLLIKFPDELQKDITYSIDFKNNIKDINEGNALNAFKYSFSTGELMDSTSISGTAKDALTKEAIEKCIIGLYKQNTDTAFIKTPPLYLTMTDENGNYRIDNIREGSYELVALIDQNGNFFFDLPNETIAFSTTDLELKKDSINKHDLFLFLEQNFPKLTISNEYNQGKVKVEISEKINQLKTKILSPLATDSIYESISPNFKEINYFYNFSSIDTALIEISGDNIIDSIKLISKSPYKPNEIEIVASTAGRGLQTIDSTETLSLKFTNCIQLIEEEKINLYRKDSLINTKVEFAITQNVNKLNIDSEWNPNKSYLIEIPPETIKDIFNQTNTDTLKTIFRINNSKSKGSLGIKIKMDTINNFQYLYELRDRTDDIIFNGILQDTLLQIPDLNAGTYKFKTIQDSNSNSKWDTGNYLKKRQPEKIKQYEQEISIKQNFETEIKIDLNTVK